MLRITERCDKGKKIKYERSLTLPNPGHRYYILYLFIIYIHRRYIKYARALARHRSRGDFSADIRVKSGGDRGERDRALLSVTRARVIRVSRGNGHRRAPRRMADSPKYIHNDTSIENKNISRPPPPSPLPPSHRRFKFKIGLESSHHITYIIIYALD